MIIKADAETWQQPPSAVRDLALRLGAGQQTEHVDVRLRQSGRIRQLGWKRWMAFTATQSISTTHCFFDWRASAGPLGSVSARDALTESGAHFDVRALGLFSLASAEKTAALKRAELMRYLAELAWAPDAILHNKDLRWRVDKPDALAVSTGHDETTCEVLLSLNAQGRIATAFAPDRPQSAVPPYLPTPWRGGFSDYRLHYGRWIPFSAEVGWEKDGHLFIYWQATLEEWTTVKASPLYEPRP